MQIINVEGLENYVIDEYGNISGLSKKSKINIKTHINKKGYLIVGLYNRKKHRQITYLVHRLIGLTYIPNPLNYPTINHKDGIKLNTFKDNLEWVSYKENNDHALRIKLREQEGEKNHFHKLNENEVIEIFNSKVQVSILALKYKVSQSAIYYIKRGKTWRSLKLSKKH